MSTIDTYSSNKLQNYEVAFSDNVYNPVHDDPYTNNVILIPDNKYTDKNIIETEKDTEITVFDAASYILEHLPDKACSTMKLHKLLYYSQAWSLVWDECPLFKENIEAWANGPVIPELFYYHKGLFTISFNKFSIGNSKRLNEIQRNTVNSVLEFYGDKNAQWLIDLTHMEDPWKNARKGLRNNERSNKIIHLDDIANYYSSL